MSTFDQARAVTFRIGADLFAVDVQGVERVVRYVTPRPVPRLPDWIEGIVELDGRVIPVVDIRRRLGAEVTDAGAQTRLLLLALDGDWCAMVVDQVLDVRPYAAGELAPPPGLVRGLAGSLVLGTLRRGSALVLLLDAAHLFSASERLALVASGVTEAANA
ncbi:MAG: purine-binding chemotaxis protein CheW [Gemmatimonadaceae bacterium]|nr:purine-binding chemotaxis protein CheW [Gemmatimonadaceae bacterium]